MNAPTAEPLLIRRAQSGDRSAFERLYRAHVGRIFALCRRMQPGEAEELTQRVFVRAWEKLPAFRGRSAFGTWLHRLAVNVVLTERRSAARREARVVLAEAPAPQPVGPLAAGMDLERAIAGLPERARQVFVLHDIEGYRHAEIAALMGTAEGTAKAQLHRARRLLREALSR